MKRYAIVHKEGYLVRSFGDVYLNFTTDFEWAMTFRAREDADNMATYVNSITLKNGAVEAMYRVVEQNEYAKLKAAVKATQVKL